MLAKFREAGFVKHAGDKGENREHILREFLGTHLPRRYGVAKGQIVTRDGKESHSADIVIYDALNTPILYSERTAIIPIEGVYGVIEVKSTLSKRDLFEAARQIEAFKRLAPRDLGVIQTREYVTVHRASRPFGMVLGYELADNSLDSLRENWTELNSAIHDVNYFVNLVGVLGDGLLRYEKVNLTAGEKSLLIDTDEFVDLVLKEQHAVRTGGQHDELVLRLVIERLGEGTFGRLFVYLLILLSRMKLNVPDLGRYLDPDLPIAVVRES